MLRQSQQQRLLQKLSPQQIQFLKLLRVPTMEMEQRIKEEMEINPALEYTTEEPEDDVYQDNDDSMESLDEISLQDDNSEQIDIDDYLRNESDDSGDYSGDHSNNAYNSMRYEADFHQHLLDQVRMLDLNEKEEKIAEQVIGSINDDGYLSRAVTAIVDDLAFGQNVTVTEQEVESVIKMVQNFDPVGVGAYTLQECLLLQLRRQGKPVGSLGRAIEILEKHYDNFVRKHYERIIKSMHITDVVFKEAIDHILKLNPRPGTNFEGNSVANNYILPDFFIETNEGSIEIMLNSKNAPELRVSDGFRDMLDHYENGNRKDKKTTEAVGFIKQKLEAAQWFINSIRQRQSTMLQAMQAISEFQKEFFLTGDESTLKPMILKDIADKTNLDISTVSRVANSKYVQTQFGTFSLKYFFSEKITLESGEEVTNKEIKSILQEIIAAEDKQNPLRDEDLTELLGKRGYNISRRTVAKYREQLIIPVARMRKV